MRQDQLDGLVTFVHVAEHRSFTLASHQMGVSPSAVSQVVRSLEGRLGVVLFKRTTRSVKLTEAGERFINRVKPLITELAQAAEEIAYSSVEPSGVLRLVATTPAYLTVLRPSLGCFLQRYPAIDMEIVLCELRVDLVREGFDAGIGLDWQALDVRQRPGKPASQYQEPAGVQRSGGAVAGCSRRPGYRLSGQRPHRFLAAGGASGQGVGGLGEGGFPLHALFSGSPKHYQSPAPVHRSSAWGGSRGSGSSGP